MIETLFYIGLVITILIAIPALIILYSGRHLIRAARTQSRINNIDYEKRRQGNRCLHQSSKRMEVTQMGDKEKSYICELCHMKIKESELNGRISR